MHMLARAEDGCIARHILPVEYGVRDRHCQLQETEDQAHYIASSMRLMVAQLRTGTVRTAILAPEEASKQEPDSVQSHFVAGFTRHFIEGDPEQVLAQLISVAERYGTNDLTIATNCFSFEDRMRSYQLVAEACGVAPAVDEK